MPGDDFTQDGRLLAVDTPLGKDVLLARQVAIKERVAGLFRIDLELCATIPKAAQVKPDQLVGQPFSVRIALGDKLEKPYRYFHGMVNRFVVGGRDDRMAYYRAEIVPWLWLLTRTSDCKVFENKKVPDIIKEVFADFQQFPFVKFEDRTQGSQHTAIDYCTQFRETDFNFVSRLMEQNGIYYFFKHEEKSHTLIMADDSTQIDEKCPERFEFQYDPTAGAGEKNRDSILEWNSTCQLRSGKYVLRDYHFQMPPKSLEATAPTQHSVGGNAALELYDFPGDYALRFNQPEQRLDQVEKEADTMTRLRMQEEESAALEARGISNCRTFTTGHLFDLKKHFDAAQNGTYLLTAVEHHATQFPDYYSDESAGKGDRFYQNHFVCQLKTNRYAPSRITPKPLVEGLQSAVVIGKDGEEIEIDKFGRVRVQFFWDRYGTRNEQTKTCWVRVAQAWAGKRWGTFFWPRIGQEVLISFIEGDPDQPIIIGSLYNKEQMPPYMGDGPDGKHRHDPNLSGIKTNTTKGGEGFNELRFDDTKDKQQVFMHAERNMDVRVKADSLERIYGNRHQIIGWEKDGKKGGDQREKIYQDKHLNVKRHQIEHIEGNCQLMIGNGEADDGGNLDIVVEKNRTEHVQKDSELHVVGDQKEKIDKTLSVTVGGDHFEKVGTAVTGTHAVEAGKEIHLKSNMNVIIEAGPMGMLTLKGAGGFVTIDASGVTVQGLFVKINSGGAAGAGGGAKPQAPQDAKQAKPTAPSMADDAKTGNKSH